MQGMLTPSCRSSEQEIHPLFPSVVSTSMAVTGSLRDPFSRDKLISAAALVMGLTLAKCVRSMERPLVAVQCHTIVLNASVLGVPC